MFYQPFAKLLASYRTAPLTRAPRRERTRGRESAVERLESRHVLSAGSLDLSFSTDGLFAQEFLPNHSELFRAAGQQSDGKLVFAGEVHDLAAPADRNVIVVRLNADGSLDTSFGTSGFTVIDPDVSAALGQSVFDLTIDASDRIIVVGSTANPTGDGIYALRLDANGVHDTAFDSGADSFTGMAVLSSGDFIGGVANGVAIDGMGRIVVVGEITNLATARDFFVGRFTPAGAVDTSFDTDGWQSIRFGAPSDATTDAAYDVAIDSGGKIVVAGGGSAGGTNFAVARFNDDGSLDTDFDLDGKATVTRASFGGSPIASAVTATSLAIQSDGTIVTVGAVNRSGGWELGVARLNPSGSLLAGGATTIPIAGATFDAPGGLSDGPFVALQSDSKIVIGTSIGTSATEMSFALVRLNSDATLDASFGSGGIATTFPTAGPFSGAVTQQIHDVLIQPDGRIVAAGLVRMTPATPEDYQLGVARYLSSAAVPPTADAGGPYTVDEGGTVQLVAAFDATATEYAWDLDGNEIFETFGQNVTFDAGAIDGPATRTVTLQVTGPGGVSTDTATVDIVNVSPSANAGGPYTTSIGSPVTLAGSATDPAGAADPLTFEWDFDGDSQFDDATGANAVFDPMTVPLTPGVPWTISLRVSDGDGGEHIMATTVLVQDSGVGLVGGTLYAFATAGNDSVTIQLIGGQLVVESALIPGGSATFNPADVQQIVISAGDGDDVVSITNDVTISVELDGGAGNDLLMSGGGSDVVNGGGGDDLVLTQSGDDVALGGGGADLIYAGFGNDVIIGGDGADQIFGGGGRDLLIGSEASDWLWGGDADDILIGGSTIYDGYDTEDKVDAIDEIMGVWASSATYDERVATLTGPGGRLDPAIAVFNDDDSDIYIGGGGVDLYFADLDDSGNDDFLLFNTVMEEVIEV